jgi:hypothetical protein
MTPRNQMFRNGILGHEFDKDSSLFLHAIHSPFLQKTMLYSGFKTSYKKIRGTRKLESMLE